MKLLVVLAAAVLTVAGVLLFSTLAAAQVWSADVLSLFLPYVALPCGVALALALLARRRALVALAGVLIAWTIGACLWPALAASKAEPAASSSRGAVLRVATFNCLGSNSAVGGFASWARRAKVDVLVLQEVPASWRTTLDDLSDTYGWRAGRLTQSTGEVDILSRLPLTHVETFRPAADRRVALLATAELEGRPLNLFAVHPNTLRTADEWRYRNQYLDLVGQWIGEKQGGAPSLAAGDWNTPPWSPFFRRFLAQTGLRWLDARLLPQPTRILASPFGVLIGSPIDHVFGSAQIQPLGCELGPDLRSDHRPLECRVRVSP